MAEPMPMCPMAETCKGMMEKPTSGLMLSVPGIVLIALGIVVIVEPRILVWLVALALRRDRLTGDTGEVRARNPCERRAALTSARLAETRASLR